METVRTDAKNNCSTKAEISARHPPPRSGLVQPVSILTSDIGFAEITAMKFTPVNQ
jgi:hypothetical protein